VHERNWLGGLLATCLLVVFLATASSTPSVDAASASLQGWRIASSGSPWLEDVDVEEITFSYTDPPWWIGDVGTHDVVFRSPGVTAVSTLAYVGADEDPAAFRILPASLLAAGLAWVAMLLLYAALRPSLGVRTSLAATGTIALGTPMWSVAADAMWPHSLTVLGIAGMAFAASRDRWLLAGAFGGVGLAGRLHMSLVVAILGTATGVLRRRWQLTVLVAVGSVPFLIACAVWSRWLYGQWDPAGGYPQVDTYAGRAASTSLVDTLINEAGLLVSLDRGFIIWTPVAVVLLPALVRSWRHLPDWSQALLVSGVVYTAVQGVMNHFAGGSAFYGYRLTLELLMCSAPALSMSIPRAGQWTRRVLPALAGLQVGAIALGAIFESPGLPIEDAWTRNTFADLIASEPVLVMPWLLCGGLGILLSRVPAAELASTAEQAHERA
jgi:alpha-1,2-mannosyltransferase